MIRLVIVVDSISFQLPISQLPISAIVRGAAGLVGEKARVVLVQLADQLGAGLVVVEGQVEDPDGGQGYDEEEVLAEEEARHRQVGLFVQALQRYRVEFEVEVEEVLDFVAGLLGL